MTEKMAKEEKKLDNKDKKGYKSYCFGEIAICEEYLNGKKTGEGKYIMLEMKVLLWE